jgi:peptidoglycan/xylan/chitin deacetylase (PgdA/CDA1 family)
MPPKHLRWRWYLKAGLAAAIARALAGRKAASSGRGYRPLVLGYHRLVEDFEQAAPNDMPSMLISTAMFEEHLDWLGRHFRFVDLDEVGRRVRDGEPFTEPVAAITFDDGYRDVYELGVPILKRRGIPAGVFIVTDLVGRPFWQGHDKLFHLVTKAFASWSDPRPRLYGLLGDLGLPASTLLRSRTATKTPMATVAALLPHLSQRDLCRVMESMEASVGNGFVNMPQTMTWEMLREMQRDGFTIGSHTKRHVSLPAEPADSLRDELIGSKRALEENLGIPIGHFAYPGGAFTFPVVDELDQAGYDFAYTACPHSDEQRPELTIERLLMWQGSATDAGGRFSPAILDCQSRGLWPPSRRCDRLHQV